MVAADEGTDTARALAACERFADETTTTLLVVQGDVVTDVALDDVLSTHLVNAATATCALAKKRAWAEVETKAGRAPKGMRYVGLNADETRVVFLAGGEHDEAKKRLKLQRSALNATAEMVIRTDVIDVGIYALEARETFAALREKTYLKSLRFDLVPHFVAEQFRRHHRGRGGGVHGEAGQVLRRRGYGEAGASRGVARNRRRVPSLARTTSEQVRQRRRPSQR